MKFKELKYAQAAIKAARYYEIDFDEEAVMESDVHCASETTDLLIMCE